MGSHFNPLMECLYRFPKPTLCAVNGIAAGGGAALALCADIVIATHAAKLAFVQVPQLGIVADLGANWLLPRIAGRSRAMAACLLGEPIDAARLLEWGLVWECVEADALLPRVMSLGAQLGRLPPQTVLATRRLIDEAHASSYAQILERERLAQRELCDLPVFMASVEQFLSE
jgi:2-(1,2-epoxy-1,2-dihydrophenyl)acetyl-CoA isomerase